MFLELVAKNKRFIISTKVTFSFKLDNFSTRRTSKTLDERTEIRFRYSRKVNRDWILVQFLN